MHTETFLLPTFFASALINLDYTGLNDEEEQCLDQWFFHNALGKSCINMGEEVGFVKYHDMSDVGVLAADCSYFTFS